MWNVLFLLLIFVYSVDSFQQEQVSSSEHLYFSYYNSLFMTDGANTWAIEIVNAPSKCKDEDKCFLHSLTVLGDHLFFSYNNALMIYDGSTTERIPLDHVAPSDCSGVCYLHSLLPVEDTIWFVYRNGIMKYNDTEGGISVIKVENTPSSCDGSHCFIHSLAYLNGDLFFSANGGLMRYDGTETTHIPIMNPPGSCNGDFCYLREIVANTVSQDPDPEEGCKTEQFFYLTIAIGSGLVLVCCCMGLYLMRRLANRKEPEDDDIPYGRFSSFITDVDSRKNTAQLPVQVNT